jgi:hypothetical protein
MDCFPFIYILNTIFIFLYIILFVFLFKPAFDSLIIICLFVLMIFSGYSVIMELINIKGSLDLNRFYELFNSNGGGPLKNIIMSNLTVVILLVLLILNIVSYINGASPTAMIILSIMLVLILIIKFGAIISELSYVMFFGIPIFLTILSFVFIIIAIYKGSGDNNKLGELSNISTNLYSFKIISLINLLIFILFFVYFFIFYKTGSDKQKENSEKINILLQNSCFIILPVLYGTSSYLIYLSQLIAKQTNCISAKQI